MFAMSFQAAQGEDLRADRDLPSLIVEGDSRNEAKAKELDALLQDVEALTRANRPKDTRLEALNGQSERIAAAAAATKVEGPVVEVVLDDSNRSLDSLPDRFTPDDIVVHQQDVQAVVNALWASGAEAMMIQDQRVISTSAVRCRQHAHPPGQGLCAAVSDPGHRPGRLHAAWLDADPTIQTYLDYVEAVGLGWQVHTNPSVEFPAYSGSVDLAHATPIR